PVLRGIQAESEAATARAVLDEAIAERDAAFARLTAVGLLLQPVTGIRDSLLDKMPARFLSAVSTAPTVRVAEARLSAAERRIDAERIAATPDVTASIGLRRFEAEDATALTFGVSLPLPLFDQNRGNIDAAHAERRAADARLAQVRQDAVADRSAANARLGASASRVAAADAGVAAAEEAYRLTRIGFDAGRISQLELRTSRAALINARNAAVDARIARSHSKKPLLLLGAAAIVIAGAGGLYLVIDEREETTKAAAQGEGSELEVEASAQAQSSEEGVILLTQDQLRATGIEVVAVSQGGGSETRLSGRVQAMVDARALVGATVGGRVERVLVAPGQSVQAGQALVALVSGDAAALRADADAAQAAYVAAEQAHGRDEELADQGVVARREAEVSHAQALSALAAARAARARLSAAGAPDAAGRLGVSSPISGVVTSVQVGPGGFVPQGGVVAEVTNPSRVELVFNAPPHLAAEARTGARLRVSGPNGEFDAVVTGVAADAGQQNSGATVIRARPAGDALPPAGSPVSGSLVTGGAQQGLSVPSEAVQTVDGASVIFVQIEGGFRAVPVLPGRQAGGRTEIVRGLTGSERIAAANAFLLKAEMAKGEAEHGH
ncbi:hypothetical protein LTR94_025724, partial [Friedmanniomyces endolithicus]